jgi:hypothetical protein
MLQEGGQRLFERVFAVGKLERSGQSNSEGQTRDSYMPPVVM